jgi:FkbM family methyltransferase
MTGLIGNTVVNYKALAYKLAGRPELKYMPWPEVLRATNIAARVWTDVVIRGRYRTIAIVSDRGGPFVEVEMNGWKFYYPKGTDTVTLGRTYFEIFDSRCAHFYDIAQTQPLSGDVALDIGACEGLWSLKNFDSFSDVYIFEPSRAMCDCLRLTFAERDQSRIHIMNMILADETAGAMNFIEDAADPTLSRIAAGAEPFSYKLEMAAVDSLVASGRMKAPTLIKMDVQGAEMKVLRGAERVIKEFKPRMAVTTYHNPMDATEILDFCLALRPDYKYILKGITTVEPVPRPTMVHLF